MEEFTDFAKFSAWLALMGMVLMLATTMLVAWLVASIVYPRVPEGTPVHRIAKLWSRVLAFPVEIMAYTIPILAFLFFILAVASIAYPLMQMT